MTQITRKQSRKDSVCNLAEKLKKEIQPNESTVDHDVTALNENWSVLRNELKTRLDVLSNLLNEIESLDAEKKIDKVETAVEELEAKFESHTCDGCLKNTKDVEVELEICKVSFQIRNSLIFFNFFCIQYFVQQKL